MNQQPQGEAKNSTQAFEAQLVEFYRANYNDMIRRHARYGSIHDIEEAIDYVAANIFERFVVGAPPDQKPEPEPRNLGAFFNRAVRNKLIDGLRRPTMSSIDDLALTTGGTMKVSTRPLDEDESTGSALGWDKMIFPEEEIMWKDLLRAIVARLPSDLIAAAAMLMKGETPKATALAVGSRDGNKLHTLVRKRICAILAELSRKGDQLAEELSRSVCKNFL
jgi:hypothetical protein